MPGRFVAQVGGTELAFARAQTGEVGGDGIGGEFAFKMAGEDSFKALRSGAHVGAATMAGGGAFRYPFQSEFLECRTVVEPEI